LGHPETLKGKAVKDPAPGKKQDSSWQYLIFSGNVKDI
jgi:hypothetical protein